MKMHIRRTPGEVLRHLCLEPLNLTVTAAARSLGVGNCKYDLWNAEKNRGALRVTRLSTA